MTARSRRARIVAVLFAALAAWTRAVPPRPDSFDSVTQDAGTAGSFVVPRMASAESQLAWARELKRRRLRASDGERAFWTVRAVAAYRAVRELHPTHARVGAEAAFRAGRLLAASGRVSGAFAELEIARQLGGGTPFRARAGLECARLHRGAGRHEAALTAALAVAADPSSHRDRVDEAWFVAANAWSELARPRDARRAWAIVTEHARDARRRVLAYDRWGMSWCEEGEWSRALDVLHRCFVDVASACVEQSDTGARVRRALVAMRIIDVLPPRLHALASE